MAQLVCGGPFGATPLCQQWRECNESVPAEPKVKDEAIPHNLVYYQPPGMALDSRWSSQIGAQVRELVDSEGTLVDDQDKNLIHGDSCQAWFQQLLDEEDAYEELAKDNPGFQAGTAAVCNQGTDPIFAVASKRAMESSMQWLQIIEEVMVEQAGKEDFWNQVKNTESSFNQRTNQFEQFNRLPYQFLTTGPYLKLSDDVDAAADEYYLRVRLHTSENNDPTDVFGGSGTDADIVLETSGKSFILDYARYDNLLIKHNDFEAGDDEVYTVGPFSSMPGSITLRNDAPSIGDIGEAFIEELENFWKDLWDWFDNDADYVDAGSKLWEPQDLQGVTSSGESFSIREDGGSEGRYDVNGTIRKVSETETEATYEVKLTTLKCLKESVTDAECGCDLCPSNSDEPFVLAVLRALPGEQQKKLLGWYEDVDAGESVGLNHTFGQVTVPKNYGMVNLSVAVYESDCDTASDRFHLLDEFAGKEEEKAFSVFELLGQSLAADWKLANIEVVAFSRSSETVRYGKILDQSVNAWIKAGKSRTFYLSDDLQTELDISGALYAGEPDPTVSKSASPTNALPGQPVSYIIDFANIGTGLARDVTIQDQLSNVLIFGQAETSTYGDTTISQDGVAPNLSWTVGDLPREAGGQIVLSLTVDPTLNTDINLSNTVTIAATNDVTPTNNSGVADIQVTVPRVAFSAANYSAAEDSGQINLTLGLDQINPYAPVDVTLTSGGGTAQADLDYTPLNQVVTIPAGVQSVDITLPVTPDEIVELDETVGLMLSNPVGAALGGISTATAAILNDDRAMVTIDDVTQPEGTAPEPTPYIFTITLDKAVDVPVEMVVNTAAGTALTDADFAPIVGGSLFFDGQAGEQEMVTVNVVADDKAEFDDMFFVNLSDLQAQGRDVSFADDQGAGTIVNDDRGANLLETGILLAIGNLGSDQITVKKGKGNNIVDVRLVEQDTDVATTQSFGPGVVRLVIFGDTGADHLKVIDNIGPIPIELYGGEGDDILQAGKGPAVLVGGPGQDRLDGSKERDILIGGLDSDDIKGHAGEDILIGDIYVFADDRTAITALADVWNDAGIAYLERINMLGQGVGPAGAVWLGEDSVLDDDAADKIQGKNDLDWFWANPANDNLDQRPDELTNIPSKKETIGPIYASSIDINIPGPTGWTSDIGEETTSAEQNPTHTQDEANTVGTDTTVDPTNVGVITQNGSRPIYLPLIVKNSD